jgi:hypothetical protein
VGDDTLMSALTGRVAALLFGSGFCALVYQLGWFREFRLIFGASTAASAAVLAIFIGGLGAGGLLIGPRADRDERPLQLYATLETIVAVSAALTPLLLTLIRILYITIGGSSRLGLIVSTIVRLVLSAIVLLIPTLAMGGTLPAAAMLEQELGVKTLMFSFSTADENLHAPNEFFRLARLDEGIAAWSELWRLLAVA